MRARLVVAAVATLGATAWIAMRDENANPLVVEATSRGRQSASAATPASTIQPASRWLIEREAWSEASADPFVPKQPPPPPPPVLQPVPPSRPTAPPFPYKYFGRVVSPDGAQSVYLTQGTRLIPIAANETLDGAYRIESISDTQIVVVYLPLGEKTILTLPLGSENP